VCFALSLIIANQAHLCVGIPKTTLGLVYCEREKSLVEVMNRINETRVHRLYVVDEQRKPVGVVSLTDIYHSLQRVIA
jgi:predicted transcriptional regulator